ncbi:hypothetical protein EHI42_28630 [Rhizobium hidalgonense]|uniref:hypothetical protein n=1 Tax=Rhizobium hidalgonense TaxID=1538159 RepID=UPI0004B26EEA|nr:hypothetical protein [Rhizobium hidalgonense]RWX08425.1 hypothetical protein EHI42_28630 [Rhizobium hidalgonense]
MSENSFSPASGPITPEADDILETKNVVFIPDICVTVSHYEWIRHRQGENWPREEMQKRLKAAMRAAIIEALK